MDQEALKLAYLIKRSKKKKFMAKKAKEDDGIVPAVLAVAGGKAASIGEAVGVNEYINRVWSAIDKQPEVREKLIEEAKAMGMKVHKYPFSLGNAHWTFIGGNGPLGKIIIGKDAGAGVVAHEMGHGLTVGKGLRKKPLQIGYVMASRSILPSLGAIYSGLKTYQGAFQDKPEEALKGAHVASLAMAPMVLDETAASAVGSKLLSKHRGKLLSSFGGFPTYLATAALPYAAYFLAKALGAFEPETRKKRGAQIKGTAKAVGKAAVYPAVITAKGAKKLLKKEGSEAMTADELIKLAGLFFGVEPFKASLRGRAAAKKLMKQTGKFVETKSGRVIPKPPHEARYAPFSLESTGEYRRLVRNPRVKGRTLPTSKKVMEVQEGIRQPIPEYMETIYEAEPIKL